MAMALRIIVVALSLAACEGAKLRAVSQAQSNPIRKVVTLLQAMQQKVVEQGEKEKELYEHFMCYCKTGTSDLSASIAAADTKVGTVASDIKGAEASKEEAEGDLKQAQDDRSGAKAAMAEATAIREKESAAYAAEKAEYEVNIKALGKAIAALSKGMSGSFLQSSAAGVLKRLVQGERSSLAEEDRENLVAFLSNSQGSDYAPQSGEINGILKQLEDELNKGLSEATGSETASKASYDELMAAKTKEVAACSASIEQKLQRIAELGVGIAQMKNDLTDTEEALIADKDFLGGLGTACTTKTAEFEEIKKTRAEELLALADTIKVLNDDDALDLFKKTLPGASSFVQVQVSSEAMRARALGMLKDMQRRFPSHPRINFITLALHGKKIGFEKIIKLIDELVATLKKEGLDDEHKKEYCEVQFDMTEDKIKALTRSIADVKTAIADAKEGIATSVEEIAALKTGISALDKAVAEATEQRKEENVDFKALMASDTAAKELLHIAKNRLNKFYNPKLYKEAKKVELSEADRINVNMGGEAPATEAPGGIAGTGVTAFVQVSAKKDAPPPPPETMKAYAKKGEESGGVIAMIDLLIKDLQEELTVAETSEKDAQADYEKTMVDSAEKRTMDAKSLTDKEASKADLEGELETSASDEKATTKELMATGAYMASLHAECDWLMQYFDVRKEARDGEIDALGKAKDVLSGADYALVQTGSRSRTFLSRA